MTVGRVKGGPKGADNKFSMSRHFLAMYVEFLRETERRCWQARIAVL